MGKTRNLTFEERQLIELGIKDRLSSKDIAKLINKSAQCVSLEISKNKGRENYRAEEAQQFSQLSYKNRYSRKTFGEGPDQSIKHRVNNLEMQLEIVIEELRNLRGIINGSD